MEPIPFRGQTVVIAKDQPQYKPLPAHYGDGEVTCCWSLTWRERLKVLLSGRIWHTIKTFNQPLQPQLLRTANPLRKAA